jgi:hypothetical protein
MKSKFRIFTAQHITKQINLNNVKTAIGNGGLFYVIEDSTNGVKLGYSVLDKQGQILVNFNRK